MSKNKQTSDKQQNGNDFIADVSSMLVANNGWVYGTLLTRNLIRITNFKI
jgi:hypothetical protein